MICGVLQSTIVIAGLCKSLADLSLTVYVINQCKHRLLALQCKIVSDWCIN